MTVLPVTRVCEPIVTDVARGFDLRHHVIPNVRAGDATTVESARELAVDFLPGPPDTGAEIAAERIDQIRELLRDFARRLGTLSGTLGSDANVCLTGTHRAIRRSDEVLRWDDAKNAKLGA